MNIKKFRKAKGLTQVELAKMLALSQETIACYETNRRKPDVDMIPKIAAALGIDIEGLFSGERVEIQETATKLHKNSRLVKIQELFAKLPPERQENIYKLVKDLAK